MSGNAYRDHGLRYVLALARGDVRYSHGFAATVRALWGTLRGFYGKRCQDCGRAYMLWHAPDEMYEQVIGSDGGLYCPACFDAKADAMGRSLEWCPRDFSARSGDEPLSPATREDGP